MGNNKFVYKTRNLSVAGYLHMQGLKVLSVRRLPNKSNEWRFVFEDPDDRGEELSREYPHSDCYRYDGSVKFLRNFANDCADNARGN